MQRLPCTARSQVHLLTQTRAVLLNHCQNVTAPLSGLHAAVTVTAHGPRTRSLRVQPCGHTRTPSRCPVVAVLTVLSRPPAVTCGHDAGLCIFSHLVACGHMRTQPPVSAVMSSHVLTRGWGTQSLCVQSCRHVDAVPVTVCTGISGYTWSPLDTAPQSLHTHWSCGHGVWSPCAQPLRGHAEMAPGWWVCTAVTWSRRDGARWPCVHGRRVVTQRWRPVAGCAVVMITSQGAFALCPGTCGDSWLLWSPAPCLPYPRACAAFQKPRAGCQETRDLPLCP